MKLHEVDVLKIGSTDVQRLYIGVDTMWEVHTCEWYIGAIPTPVKFGIPGDIPVPGDYLNLGYDQLAVYRPSTFEWFVRGVSGPIARHDTLVGNPIDRWVPTPGRWGNLGYDVPAVFWSNSGIDWVISEQSSINYGAGADIPIPGYWDDSSGWIAAIFRPSNGGHFQMGIGSDSFGVATDLVLPGDYSGLGYFQPGVWRDENQRWYMKYLDLVWVNNYIYWPEVSPGADKVPGDYLNEGYDQPAYYDPTTGAYKAYSFYPTGTINDLGTMPTGGKAVPANYGDGFIHAVYVEA